MRLESPIWHNLVVVRVFAFGEEGYGLADERLGREKRRDADLLVLLLAGAFVPAGMASDIIPILLILFFHQL